MNSEDYRRRFGEADYDGAHPTPNFSFQFGEIREIIRGLSDSKQNKVHIGWTASAILFLLTQLGGVIWWGATLTSNQKVITEAVQSAATVSQTSSQMKLRDLQLTMITNTVTDLKKQNKELIEQVNGLESSVQQLYSINRRKK